MSDCPEASLECFHSEVAHRFLDGSSSGAYQDALIADLEKVLPRDPALEDLREP